MYFLKLIYFLQLYAANYVDLGQGGRPGSLETEMQKNKEWKSFMMISAYFFHRNATSLWDQVVIISKCLLLYEYKLLFFTLIWNPTGNKWEKNRAPFCTISVLSAFWPRKKYIMGY